MREATFNAIIRVRNTETAIQALVGCWLRGLKIAEGLDARVYKLDPKFGWTVKDVCDIGLKCKTQAHALYHAHKVVRDMQETINDAQATAPAVVKAVKAHTKPKRAGRKANKRKAQVEAAQKSGAEALAVHRAKFASQSVKATPANQAPKPEPKAEPVVDQKIELQAHIAQLLEDAKAVARKRSPKLIDEAQARLDRDVAAVLSQLG